MNRLLSALWARLNPAAPSNGSPVAARPAAQLSAQRRRLASTPPGLLRLEARLVFDGAAVDTALHVVDATAAPAADAAAHTAEPVVNPVAPVLASDAARALQAESGKDMMTVAAAAVAEAGTTAAHKEVAFVDTRISGYQTLVDGVRPGVEVVLIDSRSDGLAQMADWAATHSGYDAIHVLSHGAEGKLYLGRGELDTAALGDAQVRAELQQLGQALKADGDLLLYGCSVASGATGQAFLAQLAQATGADVAASTDATGATRLGGDWALEGGTGYIDARALQIDGYSELLALTSFSSSDSDMDGTHTSITRTSATRTFTFTGGVDIGGMLMEGSPETLYAQENGNNIKLTISVESGYTFDIASFKARGTLGNVDILLTYGNNSTASFNVSGISTGTSLTTLSGFSTAIDDVKQVEITSSQYAAFNDFDIVDVKALPVTPTVTNARISISGASGTGGAYKIGDTVTATWNNTAGGDNNSGVTGVTMDFSQFGGSSAVTAVQSSGTWTASYTITSGSIDLGSRNVSVSATNVNGTTTTADTTNATVDSIAATVTDARISISGASGTGGAFKIGDTVTATWNNTAGGDNNSDTISGVTADFSQFGGGSAVSASNSAGTWTATYTIVSGGIDATGRNVTIRATDNAGNATTTADTSNARVDNLAPAVASVSVPANGTYGTGHNLDFTVNLGEAVTVDTTGGTPRIALVVGATTRYANYVSGSGTTALSFRYAVQSGEADANGITVGALSANGGTLRDAAGNDATLTLNSVGATTSVLVDAVAPVFSSATTNAAGTTLTLTYGEALSATTAAAGDFAVTAAGQSLGVASVAVSGSSVVLTLNGAVRPGQAVTVAYTDPTAGDDAGAVQDASGNDALSLAATAVTNNARASVTFDNAYQLFDNGATTGFAANTTGPDIDPNVANTGINGVYITNLRFVASAASTSGSGTFQLQGNDVTGTLEFTGTLTDSAGTPHTTTFSLSGAISKHIKTRNGNSADSEAFYFWTAGNGSPWDGLGVLMITKGSESWFSNTETNVQMPADNSYLTTLNAYQSVQSDTTPPTLSSMTMSDTALKAGDTATVTFTFSEAVTGFTNADLTIANGTLSAVSSADGGITWTATFTPTANLEDATNVITLNKAGVADAAGNAGSGSASTVNYAIDTLRPTATVTMADTALKIGDTSLVSFTFSEAVTGFTNADLSIANGTLSAVSSADGGVTWTATFTPAASVGDATNLITLDQTGVSDAAGNAGTGSTDSPNYGIDTLRPTATIAMSDTALKIGDTALVTFTFTEAVTGFTNADLTIDDGTLTAVSSGDGGLTWTATFTPTASITDASNLITLDRSGVADTAGNAGTGTVSTGNYTVDTVRPTATIAMADTALKIGDTSLVSFTFSEAVSGFTNADLTIANGTLSAVSSADGGVTWTATFTPTASVEDTTNLITLDKTGVSDAAGNTGTGTVSTANYAIDTLRPTATITMADTALKAGESTLVTFTFSEAWSGAAGALTVDNGTLANLSTSDGGITWTGTFTPSAGIEDASNLITLDTAGVVDLAGNGAVGVVSSANYLVDTLRPTATITMADTALKIGDTALVSFSFSEAVSGFTNADLTIANGTLSAVSSADGGVTWTATFTPTANLEDATNLITLDKTGVADAAGNTGTGTGTVSSANYMVDTLRPTATIAMADTALKIGDTSLVTFTFSEAVSGFTNADLSIANGTLTSVSSADGGTTWTATFTPTANLEDTTNVITLDQTGVTDAAGNTGTGTVSTANYAIDTLAPSSLASSVATLMRTDTGPGALLGTLSATESSAVTWALATGNGSNDADNALFQVVGNQLRSADTLPGGELHLFLSATDAAGNVSTRAFTLTVISNTGGPAFTTPTPVSVQDTVDADRFAPFTGTVVATDADGIAAYGLQGAASGSFSVGGQGYDRSLAGSHGTLYLDSASGRYAYVADDAAVNALTVDASESFTVTATDGHASAPMASSTTLSVNIAAANDRPALATPATVLYVDTPAADRFDNASTTLVGSDRDSGAVLSYGIAGGSTAGSAVQRVGQYGTLRVDSASGALVFTPDAVAINALTADTAETFTLTVSDGQLSNSATYTVQLRAANDLPTLQAVPGIAYTDTAAGDHFAPADGALVAADRDAATVLTHGVQGGVLNAGTSRLVGRYGTLEVNTATGAYRYTPDDAAVNALDTAATETFTLTVSDGTASASTLLTVSLAGANDRPVITSGTSASVLENASTDTVVYRATASDVDAGQTLRYRLAGTDAALFDIDAVTGEVRLKAAADYEARASYAFDVVAYDNGSGALSASQTVSLQVLDVNEAPRISSAAEAHVAENGAASARVATATASDPDVGQSLRFSLSGEDAALFDIDAASGAITIKAPADHEARASYRLLVTVTDNGQPALSDTQALTVWVDDVNEAPVLDAVAPITVAEDLAVGSVVCSAHASDVDAGQTLSYALAGPDAARFHIDARTGVVTLAQALDYETQKTLSFAIVVSDGGQPGLQAVREVTLQVSDVVEQLPRAPAPAPVEVRTEAPPPPPAPAPAPPSPPVALDDAAGRAVAPPPVPRTITAGFAVPVQTLSDGLSGTGLAVVRDIPLQRAAVSDGVARVSFTIPTDTFSHTDPQASVSLQVTMVDGRPLPAWLKFDPATGSFSGQPPAGLAGALDIRVVARDNQGHQVETQVRIQVDRTAPASGQGAPAGGQRQSEAGRPGLSGQWRGQGVFAWKLERDRLLQQARAVQAQRLGAAEKALPAGDAKLRRG